jgi:hypothetical protein
MLWIKWTGVIAAIILTIAGFYPWIIIESRNFNVSGINAEDIHLGKPAYFHFILVLFFLAISFIPRVWAKRSNLLVVALNMGWAIRNYFIITACQGGECPEKQTAIYLIIPASVLMLASALFPDMKMKKQAD